MSKPQNLHSKAGGVIESIPGEGISRAEGDTVPTDGTAGYKKGCIWIKTNGGVNTTLYINVGTKASCDFNAVSV